MKCSKKMDLMTAYEAHAQFHAFERKKDQKLQDFLIEFERRKTRTESFGSTMSEDILAYRLLKSANISEHHCQLARATITELKYDEMKSQLKKIFGDDSVASSSASVKIENLGEDTFYESDVFYGSGRNRPFSYGNRGGFRGYNQRGRGGATSR